MGKKKEAIANHLLNKYFDKIVCQFIRNKERYIKYKIVKWKFNSNNMSSNWIYN